MKINLIEYLVCPGCKGQLFCEIHREDNSLPWSEILEGSLNCEICGKDYRILEGVPRMITSGELPSEVQKTVEGFGWEWQTFNASIRDTYMTDKQNFLDFIYPITEDFFKDKFVLDAGCGMGRFLKLGAEFGSREIIGVDLSNSVDSAYANTRNLPNTHVVQADILKLPFLKKFDYIFSVGVLHHMEDPRKGFSSLTNQLKEDGRISIWVYSKENNGLVIYFLNPIRKYLTSNLPKPLLYLISHFLGFVLYGSIKVIYKPANENKMDLKLGQLLPYNDYLYYSSRLTYSSLVSVVFDHLVPQLTAYISKEDFEKWFHDENFTEITITSRNNMSWRGLGKRIEFTGLA